MSWGNFAHWNGDEVGVWLVPHWGPCVLVIIAFHAQHVWCTDYLIIGKSTHRCICSRPWLVWRRQCNKRFRLGLTFCYLLFTIFIIVLLLLHDLQIILSFLCLLFISRFVIFIVLMVMVMVMAALTVIIILCFHSNLMYRSLWFSLMHICC